MTLAERIYVAAIAAELARVNDPTVRVAAHYSDLKLSIDAPALARFALEAEKHFRAAEHAHRPGPLPEPTSGVNRG